MSGKTFREIVGGLTYENPYGLTPEERGQSKVADFEKFKSVAKDLKVFFFYVFIYALINHK